jgi:hypothetical protein
MATCGFFPKNIQTSASRDSARPVERISFYARQIARFDFEKGPGVWYRGGLRNDSRSENTLAVAGFDQHTVSRFQNRVRRSPRAVVPGAGRLFLNSLLATLTPGGQEGGFAQALMGSGFAASKSGLLGHFLKNA